MKRKRYKRAVAALRWAVEQGAITETDALNTIALAHFAGFDRDPDADEPSSTVRAKAKAMSKLKKKSDPSSLKGTKAGGLFNGARVLDASKRLSDTKHAIKDRSGAVLKWGGQDVTTQSERERCVVGCWFKNELRRAGVPGVTLTDFEKSILAESVQKGRWVGEVPGRGYFGGGADPSDFVPNSVVKALLDDTTSGGMFLAPYEFDSNIVTLPLLSGEVFPLVDLVPVTARRIEGAKMNNLGLQWGTAPGTAITPFNTASLVSELSTPVWPVSGAIELDNQMLSDSPIAIGAKVTELYSEKLKAELDRVTVSGNGYSEPLGIVNTSGLVSVSSDNGTAGPPTVSDYEGLSFGIAKQYRQRDWNCAYVMNDTTYRRARGIQVGPGDERRVFGMNHGSYELLEWAAKIQNDMPNTKAIFGAWKRYRMFQRLGSEVVVERGGRQLALTNMTLVVIRSRFGGQPIDANAFALMVDCQS